MNNSQTPDILKKIKNQKLKIAVAVEGGGLRGLVSASMLDCLKDHGLAEQVQSISGTSAGAINASYFLSNQMQDLFKLYKKMATSDFIQPLKFPNAMNLDFLFNDQIPNHHPVDFDPIRNHEKFFITVSDIEDGQSKAISSQLTNHPDDFLQLLRASCSAPLYTTNTEKIHGRTYNDGHIGLAIPYQPHLETDVDYILCLMTQKKSYRKKQNLFSKFHQLLALRQYSADFRQRFANSYDLYNAHIEVIFAHPKIVPVQIEEDDIIISKMCRNPEEVDQCRLSVKKRIETYFN